MNILLTAVTYSLVSAVDMEAEFENSFQRYEEDCGKNVKHETINKNRTSGLFFIMKCLKLLEKQSEKEETGDFLLLFDTCPRRQSTELELCLFKYFLKNWSLW